MQIKHCRACDAPIVFFKTASGRAIPIDAATVKPGDQLYDPGRHVSHFKTCTDPKRFSRKASPKLVQKKLL